MDRTLNMIMESKFVAIVRGIASEQIIPTVVALKDNGTTCVAVTFSAKSEMQSKDTIKAIAMLIREFKNTIARGAETVLTVQNVHGAAEAGAAYMISLNTSETVIIETKNLALSPFQVL